MANTYAENIAAQMDSDAYDRITEMTEVELDEMEAQTEAEYLKSLDDAVAMVRDGVWQ